MSKPPNVATLERNIARWIGLDGRKYYRPQFYHGKFSRSVFSTRTKAENHRLKVIARHKSLRKAQQAKQENKTKRWLS